MTLADLVTRVLTPYVRLRNALDYPLRRRLRFSRPVRQVAPAGLAVALERLDPETRARAGQLVERYGLGGLAARGHRRDILENLYYVDLLRTTFERAGVELPPERVEAIDVGVSDWFYAPGLRGVLAGWHATTPRAVALLGFEADPGRRYGDGHTCEAWAAWHTADLAGVDYVPDDAIAFRGQVDLALMLFPLLFTRDLDRWGLPRSLHRPGRLLAHVWARVRPGGWLVVANQGTAERDEQRRLLGDLGAPIAWSGLVESPFWRYDVERYVHVARRPG